MAFVSRAGLWLSGSQTSGSQSDVGPVRTSGILQAVATGDVRLTSLSGGVRMDALGLSNALTVSQAAVLVATSLQASNLAVADADGAGIVVSQTVAADGGIAPYLGVNERSLRWRQPSAAQPAGWDIRDGSNACVRLTRVPTQLSPELAYGLLINSTDELEMYRVMGGSNGAMRVVACFGGDRGSTLSLPLSRNPWA